jgi:hypothetical protein
VADVERWEERTVASGIGVPEHTVVVVWFRYRCPGCGDVGLRCSHRVLAEGQGARHEARNQCTVVGQLALFNVEIQ